MALATLLCENAGKILGLKVGRVHQKPIGPHLQWSCQIVFSAKDFDVFIPWLDAHREGLSVLVHALSGNDLDDHTLFAYWLGQPQKLDVSIFQ